MVGKARLALAVLALLVLAGCSAGREQGDLQVIDPWVREASAGDVSAAYMILRNETAQAKTLLGVSSDVAEAVSLHSTVQASGDDLARMEAVGAIEIPAGGTVEMKPGGYHVMLIDLRRELVPGKTVDLTLHLADGTQVPVRAKVRGATES